MYEPTEEEKKEWEKLYEDFAEEFIGKMNNENFNKVIEMFREEVEKHR